jgi:hypothetical protein
MSNGADKKALRGIWAGFAVLLLLAILSGFVQVPYNPPAIALSVAIGLVGLVIGWLAGFLLSPYNLTETKRFATAGTAVSSFLTGYLASKLDGSITSLLSVQAFSAGGSVYFLRVIGFVACCIVGGITMYTYREYLSRT